jgi:hypothetical protein
MNHDGASVAIQLPASRISPMFTKTALQVALHGASTLISIFIASIQNYADTLVRLRLARMDVNATRVCPL